MATIVDQKRKARNEATQMITTITGCSTQQARYLVEALVEAARLEIARPSRPCTKCGARAEVRGATGTVLCDLCGYTKL